MLSNKVLILLSIYEIFFCNYLTFAHLFASVLIEHGCLYKLSTAQSDFGNFELRSKFFQSLRASESWTAISAYNQWC